MIFTLDSEIISVGKITLKHVVFDNNISDDKEKQISNYWNVLLNSKNNLIHNDQVLHFVRINPDNNLEIDVSYTDYKNIIVDREFLNSELNLFQVGVSGLVINKNNENPSILFAKRSNDVTEYPNYYELVPSGNLDKSVLSNNGTINYSTKIIQEFEEETGLLYTTIDNLIPFCFIKDNINHVFDVCCILEINMKPESLISSFKTSEFYSPHLILLKNLKSFIDKNNSKIVPTSKALIQCFLQNY